MYKFVMIMAALGALALPFAPGAALASEGGGGGGEHGGGSGGEAAKPAGPIYVKIDPFVVPVVDHDGASQTISLVIAFEVEDAAGAEKIESLKPRIKDAFIEKLYGMLDTGEVLEKGVLKIGYIKERLSTIATGVLGEGVFKSVLIQMVQQNPL